MIEYNPPPLPTKNEISFSNVDSYSHAHPHREFSFLISTILDLKMAP